MNEIDRVFELIHGADGRFRTVRASIRVWRDEKKHLRAFERHFEEMQEEDGGGMVVMVGVSESEEPEPTETEETVRLWLEKPSRRREETEGRFSRVSVSDGEKSWSYAPEWGAMEHEALGDEGGGEASFLFEPAGLLPGLELEPLEETQWAGRPVVRVKARPRSRVRDHFHLGHAPGADEHELLVDAERGVLLRAASYFEGSVYAITEVTEIVFDEVLDPKIFTFEPPQGETIRRPEDLGMDHDVTIEQAAERASFRVWIPSELPRAEGTRFRPHWDIGVLYQPGLEKPRMPEMVVIFYHHDSLGSITIHERKAEAAPEPTPPWESLDLDGVRVLVLEPSSRKLPVPTQVRLQREGTEIDITSAEVDRDGLIDVARSLVPAPTAPPSFS